MYLAYIMDVLRRSEREKQLRAAVAAAEEIT